MLILSRLDIYFGVSCCLRCALVITNPFLGLSRITAPPLSATARHCRHTHTVSSTLDTLRTSPLLIGYICSLNISQGHERLAKLPEGLGDDAERSDACSRASAAQLLNTWWCQEFACFEYSTMPRDCVPTAKNRVCVCAKIRLAAGVVRVGAVSQVRTVWFGEGRFGKGAGAPLRVAARKE